MPSAKRILALAAPCCLAILLAACQSPAEPANSPGLAPSVSSSTAPSPDPAITPAPSPTPEETVDLNILLTEDAQTISVPSFLDEEQQTLYRLAYSLYIHMFGGVTTAIEYPELHPDQTVDWSNYETVELDGQLYYVSEGPLANWSDFDTAIHAVFTDDFWAKKNEYNVYREWESKLCFLDLSRGAGYYYNDNFPDEFILDRQTDTEIDFTLIGHYSPVWPREGESTEERDARRAREYDYTLEFPIRMVLTEAGWRFDEFHSALADEEEP